MVWITNYLGLLMSLKMWYCLSLFWCWRSYPALFNVEHTPSPDHFQYQRYFSKLCTNFNFLFFYFLKNNVFFNTNDVQNLLLVLFLFPSSYLSKALWVSASPVGNLTLWVSTDPIAGNLSSDFSLSSILILGSLATLNATS